jgi:hypothetical protein
MRKTISGCGRTIGATVCMLLAELARGSAATGLRADIVAAIDANQLLKMIREAIDKGEIYPTLPLPFLGKESAIDSMPTVDGAYRLVVLRRDSHLTQIEQEILRKGLVERIEQRVIHYSSDRRVVHVTTGRAIRDLARELAEHDAEDPAQQVTAIERSILANIQGLIDARAIWPRTARTGESAPRTELLDVSWELNHRDVERIIHYSRIRNAQQRLEYLDELAGCYDEGRYNLSQAAEIISEVTGEKYKAVLQRLKLAVIEGKLPTYGRGSGLRYRTDGKRTNPSQVSQFGEQALWGDLNQWLEHESRIEYRFSPPNHLDPSGIDTAATTPGVRALLHGIGVHDSKIAAAEAAAPPAQQAWPWQEDQIIRATKSLEYNPVALPPDDRKKQFFVKSLIRARCAKNHPQKMRQTIFDKAWARMLGNNPPTLKYAK